MQRKQNQGSRIVRDWTHHALQKDGRIPHRKIENPSILKKPFHFERVLIPVTRTIVFIIKRFHIWIKFWHVL